MNATEVVISEVQRNSGFQVFQFFTESIGEPRQAPKLHSHGQVLPLNRHYRDPIDRWVRRPGRNPNVFAFYSTTRRIQIDVYSWWHFW